VPLGIAAGLGQTAGKLLIFLGVRGAVRPTRLRQWLNRRTMRSAKNPGAPGGFAARSLAHAHSTTHDGGPARRRDRGSPEHAGSNDALVAGRRSIAQVCGQAADRRLMDQPVLTAPIVFLSAIVGAPPLLVTCAYAARTRITATLFGVAFLFGRSIRFITIPLASQLIMAWPLHLGLVAMSGRLGRCCSPEATTRAFRG
jgi:hypothetical protein